MILCKDGRADEAAAKTPPPNFVSRPALFAAQRTTFYRRVVPVVEVLGVCATGAEWVTPALRFFLPLERVRYVGELYLVGAHDDRDDVEANAREATAMLREPTPRQPAKTRLLAGIDRLRGLAPVAGAARLHLAKDDERAARGDEIDLAKRAAPVAIEHPEPKSSVEVRGHVLRHAPKAQVRSHAPKLGVRCDAFARARRAT